MNVANYIHIFASVEVESNILSFRKKFSMVSSRYVSTPDLDYDGLDVASGTDAMEAWKRFIGLPAGTAKNKLRASMLKYCKLDTYAMVRIFEIMER